MGGVVRKGQRALYVAGLKFLSQLTTSVWVSLLGSYKHFHL